eukprot:1716606-Amphidinium_carterae.1
MKEEELNKLLTKLEGHELAGDNAGQMVDESLLEVPAPPPSDVKPCLMDACLLESHLICWVHNECALRATLHQRLARGISLLGAEEKGSRAFSRILLLSFGYSLSHLGAILHATGSCYTTQALAMDLLSGLGRIAVASLVRYDFFQRVTPLRCMHC